MNYTLSPDRRGYSDFVRARLPHVDTTAGKVVHRWPSGLINVSFPPLEGCYSPLELTIDPALLERYQAATEASL